MIGDARFTAAIEAIDAANAADPTMLVVRGERQPKELAHSRLMTEWIGVLRPDPSEALHLAARAHHLRRWQWPRTEYPEGRAGYLRWRRDLYDRHADAAAGILRSFGYDEATVARVGEIMHKTKLRSDAEVQAYEDALCLVFVETQFADLVDRTDPDKMTGIVARTLAKMSEPARTRALDIPLRTQDAAIVARALKLG